MIKRFKIDHKIAGIVNKSTFFKTLNFIDKGDIQTPCLIIDSELIKKNALTIGKDIQDSSVFYAVKANPAKDILHLLDTLGIGFEISSEGELRVLRELNVNPDKIISSNPVKTITFLKSAYEYGLRYYAFDSIAEIDKLARYAPGSFVYLRLSVPNEGSEWPLSKKFGVEIEDAIILMQAALSKGLVPVGITFHVGSQCNNLYNWNIALDKTKILWEAAKMAGINLKIINIGGGYPVRYTRDVLTIQKIETNINTLIKERFPQGTIVHIEPGRVMVGEAGIFATSVTGKARRGYEDWLYIDVGVFNGLMESVGGIKYCFVSETHDGIGEEKSWVIAGPSCDSFDVIDKNILLREPQIGDMVLILSSGAYTVSYASEFNGCMIPNIYII
ncbi:MAG: type III PLP-dependent enzyme [Candidatus Magnetoovum sp. WYHC-5]|nr:type III PLP-dependent enzyme [Candidatus Magnetoovum sp. WYHC-5]